MGRTFINVYCCTVETHPELTMDELDEFIREEEEKSKMLTEWQEM